MERTDWLDGAVNAAQARFLMVTAITHHRFSSPGWGGDEVQKLHAELKEIELSAMRLIAELRDSVPVAPSPELPAT
ncbi:MAG TPA: hypothetical protein VGD34_16015 [Kribbella sp.]|jgi:hypothetical protein